MTEEELQNLSPEEFANTDIDEILGTLGITDEFSGYFQKFDQESLDLEKKGYEDILKGLDLKMKSIIGDETTSKATTQAQTLKQSTGFSSTGMTTDITEDALKATEKLVKTTEDQIDLGKEGAKTEFEKKKFQLYKEHTDKFYDTAANVYSNMQDEYPYLKERIIMIQTICQGGDKLVGLIGLEVMTMKTVLA